RSPIGRSVAAFHNRTVPSPLALARVLPSGLNATEQTRPVPAAGGAPVGRPAAACHTRAASAPRAAAAVSPRGRRAPSAAPLEPARGWPIGRRVVTSHSCKAVLVPLARVLPSGLNATE